MKHVLAGSLLGLVLATGIDLAGAQAPAGLGQEEFGLTERELSQRIERVEELIAKCMREHGFEYIAVDYKTVRRAMAADKVLPGMDEEEFIKKYGFGISTMYTGNPPQLASRYSPAKVGLGRRNVDIFLGLAPADQVAYVRALLGEHPDATFSVGLESENFSRCGGCTRSAIEAVFDSEQLDASYYNPKDAQIAKDPRMRAALREYSQRMRKAGFDVDNPDTIELKIRERLDAITDGCTIPLTELSVEQQGALKELQDYERRLAVTTLELEEELLEPVEERIERELFSRRVE